MQNQIVERNVVEYNHFYLLYCFSLISIEKLTNVVYFVYNNMFS